ncbi:MAG: prevent-host-death protein [Nitrospirae bacterium CG_4_10_14_0_8_um_filter_41_23]|nr:type II toxin-antitoxin system prevent-host-death family antitoxin [Nitrospirota bacterium]OIP60925.1 MAG: prevent-host-death protein [Nitrospirae bacterium CG2_30_41_42]PIQ93100.1 MAG: prevent-host-death protein [Nitrospirae bacterium CG11_big_fil_rev_8_21_14_0_20_41_14]PIV42001.1 MAG: prevent-host-death protein [Nitrospirae bacterium CG02_land_8_20_14_3_00_41_53]PIW86862.1 MAG: prevent-host-death protein [Nitrospirae bacterium CG_4_8_14_3_um_filter_41_47]PIY87402.1 MAG: prevent-host-death
MKFVTVRDFRIRPGEVWKNLEKDEEVIITSNGKPIAMLTGISDVTFDETLEVFRRTKAELAISRMRKAAVKKGLSGISREEIEAEIKAVRKERG